MKITISKSQWEEAGNKAGWTKEPKKISNCCGAEDRLISEDGPSYSDIGVCPKCKEHCAFETAGK